jgi:hypothetical protein
MKRTWTYVLPLCGLMMAPARADLVTSTGPAPSAQAPFLPAADAHLYDPCAMVSQAEIAAAAGVAADQVLTPTRPTENECIWAIGTRAGVPGQQVGLSLQTIDRANQARGLAKFGALIGSFQSLPGVRIFNNPIVTRAFSGAQIVANIGDRAGWQTGSLSVLKNELLFHVNISGLPSDATGLKVATSVAQSILQHLQTP